MFRSSPTQRRSSPLSDGLGVVKDRAGSAVEVIGPRVEAAWETARDKIGPYVGDARDTVVPAVSAAVGDAREKVGPLLVDALQTAASASEPARSEAKVRAAAALAALRGEVPRVRRWPTALGFLAVGLAMGAAAGMTAARRAAADAAAQQGSYEHRSEPVIAAVPTDGDSG